MECNDSGLCPITHYNWLRTTDETSLSEETVLLNNTLQLFDYKVNKQIMTKFHKRKYHNVTKQNILLDHPQRSNNPRKTEKKNCSRMMETTDV